MQLPASLRDERAIPSRSPTGTPSMDEPGRRVEVRERQHTDGARRDDAAGRSRSLALKPFVSIPVPAPDRALLDCAAPSRRNRAPGVLRLDLHDARIGEPAVVTLGDDGDHDVVDADGGIGGDRSGDGAVVHPADRVRRGQVDGRLEQSPLADGERAGHLAGAVQDGHARRDGSGEERVGRSRKHGGDTRCARRRGRAGGSGSSRQIVTCPTATPSTSVIAFSGPASKRPMRRPSSRSLGPRGARSAHGREPIRTPRE